MIFLFAYAILRSIPRKLGGVIALIMSIIILFFVPIFNLRKINRNQFYILRIFFFWMLVITIILLTWIGIKPVEIPYIIIGQFLSIIYYSLYLIIPVSEKLIDKIINFKFIINKWICFENKKLIFFLINYNNLKKNKNY